jgi:hypothetical protein
MITEYRIEKDVDGSGRGLIRSTNSANIYRELKSTKFLFQDNRL